MSAALDMARRGGVTHTSLDSGYWILDTDADTQMVSLQEYAVQQCPAIYHFAAQLQATKMLHHQSIRRKIVCYPPDHLAVSEKPSCALDVAVAWLQSPARLILRVWYEEQLGKSPKQHASVSV